VSTRTIRNDVERLRELDYPVQARPGVAGGYRLGAGASLPPLLLDDDEVVAVALGLRSAATGSITGIEEASVSALVKLQQMLPSRLRRRVSTLQSYAVPMPSSGPQVDSDMLTAIASACRDREGLRFDYLAHSGAATRRSVEPYRLVHSQLRWYLLSWDLEREDWRTFRVDRMTLRTPNGARFTPRELPSDDEIARRLASAVGQAHWHYRARVIVHAPATHVRSRLPISVDIESLAEDRCGFEPGSDNPEMLALYIGMLDADFEVVDSPQLVESLRRLQARYQRAIDASETTAGRAPGRD
jgi:predicted DNA-binding transcriptional regulator YafY